MTPLGRKLAGLPVDPRLGRMVLEAEKNGCVREVMVIASALSIQDPRERPADKQQQADEKHRRFADPESDFLSYLNLWNYLREQQKELSSSAFRRLCKAEFLNYLRVREWQDIYSQLRQWQSLGAHAEQPAGRPAAGPRRRCCRACCRTSASRTSWRSRAGPTGRRPIQEYIGARNARFAIFPGSALAKKQPQLGDVGRAGGDLPAVGAGQRQDRARVGRAARPAPGQTHLLRAALGEEPGRGDGATRRSRCTACRSWPGARSTTAASTPSCPASCSSGTPWSRATGTPTTRFLARQPQAARRGRGAGEPGPPPRHPGRRRDPVRLLRPARPRRRRLRPPLRLLVEEGPGRAARPARPSRPRCWSTRARDVSPATTPTPGGRAACGCQLTYQFEPGADADGVTVHMPLPAAQPGQRRRLRLADPRPARGAGHRADPVPAQARCGATSCPPPTTPSRCWSGRQAGPASRCWRPWSGSCCG